ncbi:MAG: SMC family ATPase [Candidatus Diapherotrites archaeon]|nr:SMC family ATPase [Candidatus Diapherotrites archaeon]
MIKKVLIENWRSHKRTELEFGKGSNVLIGRMGAGKSSVLNAICFAFFGTYPELQRRETNVENIIMSRPNKQDYARVVLDFSFDGKNYSIERKIYSGSKINEAKLCCEGKLIAGPKVSDVNNEIEKRLGIDYELFSRAMYAEQNNIDYILKLTPNERKIRFDQLLDLEKYEKVRKNAVTLRNTLKALSEDRKAALSEIKAMFSESDLLALQREVEELKKLIEQKQALLRDIEKEVEKAKEDMNEIIEKQKKYSKLKDEIAQLKGRISMLKKEIERNEKIVGTSVANLKKDSVEAKISSLEGKKKDLAKKTDELNEIRAKIRERKARLTSIMEENERLKAAMPKDAASPEQIIEKLKYNEKVFFEIESEIKSLKKETVKSEEELTKIKERVEVEKNKIYEAQEKIKALEKAGALCPTCSQKLTDEHKKRLLKEFNKIIEDTNSKIKSATEISEKISEKIKVYENRYDEASKKQKALIEEKAYLQSLNEKAKRIQENENALAGLVGEISELESKERGFVDIRTELEDLQIKLDCAKVELELTNYAGMLTESEEKLALVEKEIFSLGFDESKALDIKANFERKNAEKRALEDAIDSSKSILAEKKRRQDELERRSQQIKALEGKITASEMMAEKILLFINAIKSAQAELRETLIDAINQAMNQLWTSIYPYSDYSEIRLSASETYELMVKSNGNWISVQGNLSGGETSVAALVLRISTSLVLARSLRVLILDEPTHNLDERTIEVLSGLVKEILPRFVEQIFLITHERGMEKAASATLYMLSKDEEHGNVTKAELISLIS